MKSMIRILSAMGLAVAGWWLVASPTATAQSGSKEGKGYPLGKTCVVTVDPASRHASPSTVDPDSGLSTTWTAKGQLLEVSPEWVVLKEGTFDNWIPRNKVLMIRVSQ